MNQKRIVFLTVFITSIVIVYFFIKMKGPHRGPFDIVDKENNKVGLLFEKTIEKEKASIEHGFYSGIKPTAVQRLDDYLKTIQFIELYASHGTESDYKFNYLEVNIVFKNGQKVNKLFTGQRVLQAFDMGAQFLVKMELNNGKVVKALTNGVERNNTPDYITADLELIKKAVLRHDMQTKGSFYYYAGKTEADIKQEWDSLK
jgi:hypothetical protein